MRRITPFIIAFSILASLRVEAQNNTYALVIGISKYKEITPLQFADRDALAFAECLKIQKVPESNIKVFINEEANRLNILDGLFNLTAKVKAKDRLYFYFGGHGDLEAQISYHNSLLLLYDCFKKNYFQGSEFISLSELKTWLGDLAKKQVEVVFIADACHSGGLIGGKEGVSKTQTALNDDWAGITKILSCKSTEFSLEGKQWGGGRGLFSYHLVNGLTGRADANKDKKISVGELDNYLKINVSQQANPNVQTPVVVGNSTLLLTASNTAGLKKLAEMEQKNFALMTEVNTRTNEDKLLKTLATLDTSIVETYKKFSKALKEKRVTRNDDSTDNAVIHYRKLESYKVPDDLMQLAKRNLGAALLDLELSIMKGVREKGNSSIPRTNKNKIAIQNLENVQALFGPEHYIYKFLQARITVLEGFIPFDVEGYITEAGLNTAIKRERPKEKERLLASLKLEPNMISTYVLLAATYRALGQQDSAIFYQEKVVQLLPNEPNAFYSLGQSYASMSFSIGEKKRAPHPKAIEYLDKTIALDSTFTLAYSDMGNLYMGSRSLELQLSDDTSYHNYKAAIPYFERLSNLYKLTDSELAEIASKTRTSPVWFMGSSTKEDKVFIKLYDYLTQCWNLHLCYKKIDDKAQSAAYWSKIQQLIETMNTTYAYMRGCKLMYELYDLERDPYYLNTSLKWNQLALQSASEKLKTAKEGDLNYLHMQYWEMLKAMGVTHRILTNYSEAEKYYRQAIDYPLPKVLRILTRFALKYPLAKRFLTDITGVSTIRMMESDETDVWYEYGIDPYLEMFHLKMDENKPIEAKGWYEKMVQETAKLDYIDGNGLTNFEDSVFFRKLLNRIYKDRNLDLEELYRFTEKYFPPKPAEKK
jgi:hypothetical protein